MSFSAEAKAEICREKTDRNCCALAECCGILMYCHTFSPAQIKISTTSPDFVARAVKLFRLSFGAEFDRLPEADCTATQKRISGADGNNEQPGAGARAPGIRRSLIIDNPEKISAIYNAFGFDPDTAVSLHVNFALLEEECCKAAFLRGAFLAGGSVTDPEKRYHLELSTSHRSAARETCSIMQELGFQPGESSRGANTLLYFKQSDIIADFLTAVGAPVTAMGVMTAKVDKEMKNAVTRQINCDSANADRTVLAARQQIDAIRRYSAQYGLDSLPENLKDTALLRITNPEASLADLASLSIPQVSKSCLSHRLKRIAQIVSESETDFESGL